MAEDVRSGSRSALPEGVVRDLVMALGWAAFVGAGIAIGLALGALGSDVGADPEMILIAAAIAGLGTFVVRLLMIVVRRGFGSGGGTSETSRAPARPRPDDGETESKPVSGRKPSGRAKRTAGTRRSTGTGKSPRSGGSPGPKKSRGGKKPAPRKRSSGS